MDGADAAEAEDARRRAELARQVSELREEERRLLAGVAAARYVDGLVRVLLDRQAELAARERRATLGEAARWRAALARAEEGASARAAPPVDPDAVLPPRSLWDSALLSGLLQSPTQGSSAGESSGESGASEAPLAPDLRRRSARLSSRLSLQGSPGRWAPSEAASGGAGPETGEGRRPVLKHGRTFPSAAEAAARVLPSSGVSQPVVARTPPHRRNSMTAVPGPDESSHVRAEFSTPKRPGVSDSMQVALKSLTPLASLKSFTPLAAQMGLTPTGAAPLLQDDSSPPQTE